MLYVAPDGDADAAEGYVRAARQRAPGDPRRRAAAADRLQERLHQRRRHGVPPAGPELARQRHIPASGRQQILRHRASGRRRQGKQQEDRVYESVRSEEDVFRADQPQRSVAVEGTAPGAGPRGDCIHRTAFRSQHGVGIRRDPRFHQRRGR